MLKTINSAVLAGAVTFMLASSLVAQKASEVAPIPSQITSARKVFISNTIGDDLRNNDPAEVYNAFHAANKGSFREPIVGVAVTGSVANVPIGGSYTDPHLRLVILDPKTHVSLWWLTAHVRPAVFDSDKSLDHAITDLMAQLKQLASKSVAGVGE